MQRSDDFVQFALDLPMMERPGSRFNYCNVVAGRRPDGRAVVHLFHYGIPSLDGAADRTFRALGLLPVPVLADAPTPNELLQLGGGLHCLCEPLC